MSELFIKQLALVGALSSLVISVLWPHARPFLEAIYNKIGTILNKDWETVQDDELVGSVRRSIDDHPRLCGYSLQRSLPDVVKPKVSLQDLRQQSSLQAPLSGDFLGQSLNSFAQATNANSPTKQNTSMIGLSLFTSAIMALVLLVVMKLTSSKATSGQRGRPRFNLGYDQTNGRRKRFKMSRDERARQIILRHGNKNVSHALKILAAELQRQKSELIQGEVRSKNASDCDCSCHGEDQVNSGTSIEPC